MTAGIVHRSPHGVRHGYAFTELGSLTAHAAAIGEQTVRLTPVGKGGIQRFCGHAR